MEIDLPKSCIFCTPSWVSSELDMYDPSFEQGYGMAEAPLVISFSVVTTAPNQSDTKSSTTTTLITSSLTNFCINREKLYT